MRMNVTPPPRSPQESEPTPQSVARRSTVLFLLFWLVVMGGMSVWLNDERFIKMKPTLLYVIFAAVLGFGLLRGQSYLSAVLDEALARIAGALA